MIFEELSEQLTKALTEQLIYNSDYENFKSWANTLVSRESDAIANPTWEKIHGGSLDESARVILQDFSVNYVREIPLRIKKIQRCKIEHPELIAEFTALYHRWLPIHQNIEFLKPYVKIGRKPSLNPRKTIERTLENTGTCSVCSQNCKLNSGLIVHHGFIVRGQRLGRCFGCEYEPIEVSPLGAIAYRDMCIEQIPRLESALIDLRSGKAETLQYCRRDIYPGDSHWDLTLKNTINRVENEMRSYQNTIREFNTKIEAWKASPLPVS